MERTALTTDYVPVRPPTNKSALTPRKVRFVLAYLADPSMSVERAALKAGVPPASALQRGQEWLADKEVRTEIDRRLRLMYAEYEIEARRIVQELAVIGTANIMDYGDVDAQGQFKVDLRKCNRIQAGAISEIIQGEDGSVRIKLHPKLDALQKLGQYYRLFYGEAHSGGNTFNVTIESLDALISQTIQANTAQLPSKSQPDDIIVEGEVA